MQATYISKADLTCATSNGGAWNNTQMGVADIIGQWKGTVYRCSLSKNSLTHVKCIYDHSQIQWGILLTRGFGRLRHKCLYSRRAYL
jgi:hypothetical protein